MKLLLDTHILLWTLSNDPKLPLLARRLIGDEELRKSAEKIMNRYDRACYTGSPDGIVLSGELYSCE